MVSLKESPFQSMCGKAKLYLGIAEAMQGSRAGDLKSWLNLVEYARRYGNSEITKDSPFQRVNTIAAGLMQTAFADAQGYLDNHLADIVNGIPRGTLEKTLLNLTPVPGYKGKDKLLRAHKTYSDAQKTLRDLSGPVTSDTHDIARSVVAEQKFNELHKLHSKMFANVSKEQRDALTQICMHAIVGRPMMESMYRGKEDLDLYLNMAKHKYRQMSTNAEDDVKDEIEAGGTEEYIRLAAANTIKQMVREGSLTGDPGKIQEAYTAIFQMLLGLHGQREN